MKREVAIKIFFFLVFICTIMLWYKCSSEMGEKTNKLLDNNIYFTGTLIYMKASNNHIYGLIRVKIDSSNVKNYYKQSDDYIFPYRIENDTAEIYCYVPILSGLTYDKTKVILDSNKRNVYFYENNKEIAAATLFINGSEIDKAFIKKNTIFKK